MAEIEFSVSTSRTVEQVKSAIEREIRHRLPGERIRKFWEGDVLRLVGMGADGRIEVKPGQIHARATLKAPLSFMKGKVEDGLRTTVQKAAEGDGAASPAPAAAPGAADTAAVELDAAAAGELRARIDGVVLPGAQAHDEFLTNFGHIHQWRPLVVVKPSSKQDVLEALAWARARSLTVSTRGAAHSQSELAINRGGVLLDMKSMGRILEIDPAAQTITVEPGAIWRDVVARCMRHGLIPPVLTNNLSVTVGGTLSIAGIGVASFRYGAQTDNVEELEVATVDGTVHRCSRHEKADLFWGVLSGLGQLAVILQARLRLRQARPMTRTYYLLYDDVRRYLDDARTAMDSGKWDYIESWCSPSLQGFKWVEGGRQPFARWFFPTHLTVEFDPAQGEPNEAALMEGLRPYERLYVDDLPTHEFANRMLPAFDLWKKLGTWEHYHPWMEGILGYSTAPDFLEAVLPDLSPGVQVGGHVLLWPARSSVSEVPLFMHPPEEHLVGFGILPAVPPKLWDQARPRLQMASELMTGMGGKRYLSGYIEFDQAQWREHFGPQWERLTALKELYDPQHRLNPGFIKY